MSAQAAESDRPLMRRYISTVDSSYVIKRHTFWGEIPSMILEGVKGRDKTVASLLKRTMDAVPKKSRHGERQVLAINQQALTVLANTNTLHSYLVVATKVEELYAGMIGRTTSGLEVYIDTNSPYLIAMYRHGVWHKIIRYFTKWRLLPMGV